MTGEYDMKLRSDKVTVGKLNTGARALWRATGTLPEEFSHQRRQTDFG